MTQQPSTRDLTVPADWPQLRIPRRLATPEPGWTTQADVIVVGSGIAGLTAALKLRERVGKVILVTKALLNDGSTMWAQGGIAAALHETDTPEAHLHDTLVAGVGVCDPEAVRVLVNEGPQCVRDLIDLGANFDRTATGEISLTREGGHHADRIAHAGGDATGAEISRALIAALRAVEADPDIEVVEHAMVVDLLTDDSSRVCGVTLHVLGEGEIDGVGAAHARAVVLATGGLGQVYSATTNPSVSTGGGMAAALRAGAELADLEFVQFHPTVLWLGEGATGQQPLISEAMRGEGAVLVDAGGTRFMEGIHPLKDLAPRDVVARAIVAQMAATGTDHVFLDARHLGAEFLESRFPSIVARCRELGFDPVHDLLPVAPAQHYASGGVRVDLDGRTSLEGLYAVGETSCTGVHGANRLASNSLLEGLVFAHRIAADLGARLAAGELPATTPTELSSDASRIGAKRRREVQGAMTRGAGAVRTAASLRRTAAELAQVGALTKKVGGGPKSWESTNLLHVGWALTLLAWQREETRGGHLRADHPERDDAAWLGHQSVRRDASGALEVWFRPVTDQAAALAALSPDAPAEADLAASFAGPGFPETEARRVVATALDEDLGPEDLDVTSMATIPADQEASAVVVARAAGVVAGGPAIPLVVQMVAQRTGASRVPVVEVRLADGTRVERGDVIATITGPVQQILIAERTMLNILSRLSGVATHTAAWAEQLAGTKALVLDTRKTTPGLRALEKYAVRAGGGTNKRMGLYDVAMIKDNHKLAAGSLTNAWNAIRTRFPNVVIQVEVTTTAEAIEAVQAGARFLLCDNMSPALLRETVDAVRALEPELGEPVELEATGGLTLEVAREYAQTGVDFMSVGGLTHSSPILDIALDLVD
ncbi:L-aspartate oxidase [Kribbia dieselivorans]|uniref:L-aspartate oxidase n=1 Tax=Kribbia dieselivorans TaxID=331526 RepID=UPI0008399EA4